MKKQVKMISSWMGVFKQKAVVITCDTEEELLEELRPPKVVGSFHSYNTAALDDTVILLGKDFNYIRYNEEDQTCTIGAATKVYEVIYFLMDRHRRLINRGNFDQQTLVGAAVTGTHGYGPQATIMDSVIDAKYVKNVITEVTIKTAPLERHKVTISTKPLSEIGPQAYQRFYAVLPYSASDPVCLTVDHELYEEEDEHPEHVYPKLTKPPLYLRAWWFLDKWTYMRRWIQRAANFLKIPDRVIYTDSHDVDYLYDPMKGIAGKDTWDFISWAYKPTYTCYNIALFVKPEDTEEVIQYAIEEGLKMHNTLFRCIIGVRELTDESSYINAGNFDGPRNAIDFYCDTRHAQKLIKLQKMIQEKFDTRPHYGKTVFV